MIESLGIIGAVILSILAIYYVYDIIFGTTRPQRLSWGVWMLVGFLGFSTAEAGGAGAGAYVAAVNLALMTVGFTLSLSSKYGKPDHEPYDPLLGATAVAAVIAWRFFNLPINIAASAAVIIELIAIWPTLRGTWRLPHTEPLVVWSISTIAATMGAVAALATTPTYSGVAYPICLVFIDLAVTSVLVIRHRYPPAKEH